MKTQEFYFSHLCKLGACIGGFFLHAVFFLTTVYAEPATLIYGLGGTDSNVCDISLNGWLYWDASTDSPATVNVKNFLTGQGFVLSPKDADYGEYESGRYTCGKNSMTADSKLFVMDSERRGQVIASNRSTTNVFDISVNNAGKSGNNFSRGGQISENGAVVAFTSLAGNLAASDNNGVYDVFARNLKAGKTRLVSGQQWWHGTAKANASSWLDSISETGRFITFVSSATNLTATDRNKAEDIFIKDLQTDTLKLVSINRTGKITGNKASQGSSVSADGRFVAFASEATDLVADNLGGGIFVRDMKNRSTERIAAALDGDRVMTTIGAYISPSAQYVAFTRQQTKADLGFITTNLYLYNRKTKQTTQINLDTDGNEIFGYNHLPSTISPSGRYVAFFKSEDIDRVSAVIRRLW